MFRTRRVSGGQQGLKSSLEIIGLARFSRLSKSHTFYGLLKSLLQHDPRCVVGQNVGLAQQVAKVPTRVIAGTGNKDGSLISSCIVLANGVKKPVDGILFFILVTFLNYFVDERRKLSRGIRRVSVFIQGSRSRSHGRRVSHLGGWRMLGLGGPRHSEVHVNGWILAFLVNVRLGRVHEGESRLATLLS